MQAKMHIPIDHPVWEENRYPVPSPDPEVDLDASRRAAYWEWSNAYGHLLEAGSPPKLMTVSDGREVVRLMDAAQADYEAFHMQHSVGYNWEHYSGFGDIYSMRRDGIPEVSFLVSPGGMVIHARRKENAPLLPEDVQALAEVMYVQEWTSLEVERL